MPDLDRALGRPHVRFHPVLRAGAAAGVVLAVAPLVSADLLWNEQIDGDFSDDRRAPTPLVLAAGANSIFGRLEGLDTDGNFDRDYYSLTIPAGHRLASIILETYLSNDFAAFMGIEIGPIFPHDPDTVQESEPLGWVLFGPSLQGEDLLPLMGMNGRTFAPPLPAGTYTIWAQQIGDFTEYSPIFNVEPIPAPAASALLLIGAFSQRRRRRSRA